MKSLSAIDGAFLFLETPQTPMHVASLHLFDLPARYRRDFHDAIKRLMARRLHQAPIFRRRLAPMPLQFAGPVWIHDDDVDLDYHVQHLTLPPPGTLAQLEECAGRLHSELMDRSRPLWRLYVIDGLQSGQVGYYFKVHHAALDGQAGVLLAGALFDLTPRPRAVRRPRRDGADRAEHPGTAALAAAALRHDAGQYVKLLRHLPDVVRTLAGMFGAKVGTGRRKLGQNFAFGSSFAPHPSHSSAGLSGAPHSGQNLPPAVSAWHFGQRATISSSRFRPRVWSFCRTFSRICSTCAADCAAAISTSVFGAHSVHRPRFAFQHTSRQTQPPQRTHWMKLGLTWATAALSAASWAGPPIARWIS